MNERERAERLARAIDDLLKAECANEAANEPPAGLEEEELSTLIRVARDRVDAAGSASHASLQHEGAIWQQVLFRLDRRIRKPDVSTTDHRNSLANAWDFAAAGDSEADELRDIGEIIRLRRQMAEQVACLAERHRESVWQEVQSRIRTRSQTRRSLPALRHSRTRAVEAVPDLFRRKPVTQEETPRPIRAARPLRPRFAAIGAVAALVVAAIGPLPATGLAGHPAVQFARFVGDHTGITESGPPPSPSSVADTVEGTDASASEAAAGLGFPVAEPAVPPGGFALVSSRIFPRALTAAESGMFVLTYAGTGADQSSLVIYQERASGGNIAAQNGSVFDVVLGDGTPASYLKGSWQTRDSDFTWNSDHAQTLIVDRSGVRAIIQYIGPSRDPAFIFSIADNLVPVATTH